MACYTLLPALGVSNLENPELRGFQSSFNLRNLETKAFSLNFFLSSEVSFSLTPADSSLGLAKINMQLAARKMLKKEKKYCGAKNLETTLPLSVMKSLCLPEEGLKGARKILV